MSVSAPGVTGPLDLESDGVSTLDYWVVETVRTGSQHGYMWHALETLWGESATLPEEGRLRVQSPHAVRVADLARSRPHVATAPRERPRITGNLAEDVREVTGLPWSAIASLFGISERAVASWRTTGVPRHRDDLMQALRAIGAMLVGGLGPDGVREWLAAGDPSRLDRIRGGDLGDVVSEANEYADSPAT